MHIVGHTLVWNSQLADFMNEVTDKTIMSNYVSNHINTIVKRYKGKIDTWDVVNEALNEDGTLRESIFLKTHGENTKLNLEDRTPEKLWELDESLYAKSALNRYKNDPDNKILIALLKEEEMRKKRNTKITNAWSFI